MSTLTKSSDSKGSGRAPVAVDAHAGLRALIASELEGLVRIRRDLHQHPELSNQERRTSKVVQRELAAMGIPFKAGVGGGTGIVAYIAASKAAGNAKPAVGLRADMDALPIEEATGKPYSSTVPGVMHACGHDGHTTMLLGAARVLLKMDRPHPVTLVFQPAEEDGGGAEKMCAAGALAGESGGGLGAPVGRMYGLHGWPQLDLGKVATRPGPLLAATDDFDVRIVGVGGHAAYPHLCKDPIVAASAVVIALQTLVSRGIAPYDAGVLTVGQFLAGTANNIIPDSARLVGTVRTLTPELRKTAKTRFFEIVQGVAAGHGCRAEINWHEGYPVTMNDAAEAERVMGVAAGAFGAGRLVRIEHPTMGGEDFSYYGHHVPACFFFLGLRPQGLERYPALHQPDFDFNDEALPTGVEMLCRLGVSE
jgi:amidohydrolase